MISSSIDYTQVIIILQNDQAALKQKTILKNFAKPSISFLVMKNRIHNVSGLLKKIVKRVHIFNFHSNRLVILPLMYDLEKEITHFF